MNVLYASLLAGVVSATPLCAADLRIDSDGINGHDDPILFSQIGLVSLFPDYTVAPAQHPNTFGAETNVFAISHEDEILLFADVGFGVF